MNDPKAQPIDIEEQRLWLLEHKKDTGLPWPQLATRLGPTVNKSTLSLFATGNYNGRLEPLAEAIFRYRQTLASQAANRYSLNYVRVPLARELRARHYRANGLSNGEIASKLGMTETGVDKMFARMDRPPLKGSGQLSLEL